MVSKCNWCEKCGAAFVAVTTEEKQTSICKECLEEENEK